MPYSIHWEPNGVYKKYSGQITGEEFLGAVVHVNASSHFRDLHYVINDFSDCDRFLIDAASLNAAVAAAIGGQASNPRFIAAFVASHADVTNTLNGICDLASNFLKVALFSNLRDARLWAMSHGKHDGAGTRSGE